jgi:hypothetical protein
MHKKDGRVIKSFLSTHQEQINSTLYPVLVKEPNKKQKSNSARVFVGGKGNKSLKNSGDVGNGWDEDGVGHGLAAYMLTDSCPLRIPDAPTHLALPT